MAERFNYKVIEGEFVEFEKELNEFTSRKDIEVINIQYSTACMVPDVEYGWHSAMFHNALVEYRQLVFDENTP